jgi:hypothetical protein
MTSQGASALAANAINSEEVSGAHSMITEDNYNHLVLQTAKKAIELLHHNVAGLDTDLRAQNAFITELVDWQNGVHEWQKGVNEAIKTEKIGYNPGMWTYEQTVEKLIQRWQQKDLKKSGHKLGDIININPSKEKFGICVLCLEAGREPDSVIHFGGDRGTNSHRKPGPKGIGGSCCSPFDADTSHYKANSAGQMHAPAEIMSESDTTFFITTLPGDFNIELQVVERAGDNTGKLVLSCNSWSAIWPSNTKPGDQRPYDMRKWLMNVWQSRQIFKIHGPKAIDDDKSKDYLSSDDEEAEVHEVAEAEVSGGLQAPVQVRTMQVPEQMDSAEDTVVMDTSPAPAPSPAPGPGPGFGPGPGPGRTRGNKRQQIEQTSTHSQQIEDLSDTARQFFGQVAKAKKDTGKKKRK